MAQKPPRSIYESIEELFQYGIVGIDSSATIRLLSARYVVMVWKTGRRLVRRQELPEEAFPRRRPKIIICAS